MENLLVISNAIASILEGTQQFVRIEFPSDFPDADRLAAEITSCLNANAVDKNFCIIVGEKLNYRLANELETPRIFSENQAIGFRVPPGRVVINLNQPTRESFTRVFESVMSSSFPK